MPDDPISVKEVFKNCVQVGAVVNDLDQSMQVLTQVFGIGPFRVIDWPPAERTDMQRIYHGDPAEFTARMAFTQIGTIELELIQPVGGKSIWADFLREHGPGLHHIRFNTYDMDSLITTIAQSDIGVTQQGSGIRPGTKWANFDTQNLIGFTIEVMQAVPGTDGLTPQVVNGKVLT